ncbi:MAG: sigma-54-dependent transcriptional regulator [Bdellovibrionales bacterium]
MKPTILAIDNDSLVLQALKIVFEGEGIDIQTATSGLEGIEVFRKNPEKYAAVLVDFEMKENGRGLNGDEVVAALKSIYSDAHVIMVSGRNCPTIMELCRRAGAEEYIVKDTDVEPLVQAVKAIIIANADYAEQESETEREEKISRVLGMVGRSAEMAKVATLISKFSRHTEPVLILGESGVGKEGIARAVHDNSGRVGEFVAINCGAIGRELLESELFGHEKGAFTGALSRKVGAFERANRGTIFLDEIGDMPIELQVKILRALQEKTIQPVGGIEKKVDYRVVAATHRDLKSRIDAGEFRQDLYYRLKYYAVEVPPLRERPEDIEPLVRFFLQKMEEQARVKKGISATAMRKLKSHSWPGNVRDLEATVKKAFVLSGDKITLETLKDGCTDGHIEKLQKILVGGELMSHAQFMKLAEDAERWLLTRALEVSGDRKGVAATLLGMKHNSMNYRRSALGLEAISLKKGGLK